MARIKVNPFIEQNLWRQLKAECALLGTDASTILEGLIAKWLEEQISKSKKKQDNDEH